MKREAEKDILVQANFMSKLMNQEHKRINMVKGHVLREEEEIKVTCKVQTDCGASVIPKSKNGFV